MAQPMSVEEVKAMLDTTEKGGVRNSIKNCLTVFQHDPLLSGAIAYNLLTDRTDVVKPIGYDRSPSASMTDTDMKYIRLYLEENYDLTSEKKIIDAADLAAHQNSYHPVRDFLNSLTWDGTERIRYCLHHFLGAEADEYTFQALAEVFVSDARHEMAYQRRLSRHKAQYSLDCDDGIEYSACLHEPTPQELLERMELFIRLWNALNSLPEIQGRRIDAHIILGKSIKEIAEAEGVHEESVRQSIKRGLERMKKTF